MFNHSGRFKTPPFYLLSAVKTSARFSLAFGGELASSENSQNRVRQLNNYLDLISQAYLVC